MSKNNLDYVLDFTSSDIEFVNNIMINTSKSHIDLINDISLHIINSGGKRLRAIISILSSKALNAQGDYYYKIAAAIEFIHTATLLHDDVVDDSKIRRNHNTANDLWGNNLSILVGDLLFTKSFKLMMECNNLDILKSLNIATSKMAEGEVLQISMANDLDISEDNYMDIITHKTAYLFAASAQMGALIANAPQNSIDNMYNYALNFGIAFQIVDDVLDYVANSNNLGKNIGDDLKEGRITLPLILSLKRADNKEKDKIKSTLLKGFKDQSDMFEIISFIKKYDGITKSMNIASKYVDISKSYLDFLPNNNFKQSLSYLADYVLTRDH